MKNRCDFNNNKAAELYTGGIYIYCLDKYTVDIELDDQGCKYLIEVLTMMLNDHNIDQYGFGS